MIGTHGIHLVVFLFFARFADLSQFVTHEGMAVWWSCPALQLLNTNVLAELGRKLGLFQLEGVGYRIIAQFRSCSVHRIEVMINP
jgi:hypothetical protein